ncbi:MAG: protease modulator HflC [Rhodobacteraceae bacterium]|nr:protease modulator HflC [Paracoccaceae bacterium]
MMRIAYVLPVLAVVVVTALSSIFIVDERKMAIVLQFGEVTQVKQDPGLGVKLPFVQDVVYYDGRILGLQTEPIEVTLLADRRLVVDAFARWRIVDPVIFRQAVGAAGEDRAQVLLGNILQQAIPEVLGNTTQAQVLSPDRTGLMNQIRDIARREGEALGVEVIDVRLTRTDLPEQNLNATYARMKAEREREAAEQIARGGEAAQRVRAAADREVVELTSKARREADVIRGEADAERNRVLAEAYGADPEFFAFLRSMNAYETALKAGNSSIVLSPDNEFFDYFSGEESSAAASGATAEAAPRPAAAAEPAAEAEPAPAAEPAPEAEAAPAPAP